MPARLYIAWARLCRPGCVIGHQQDYLCVKEDYYKNEGIKEKVLDNFEPEVQKYITDIGDIVKGERVMKQKI